MKKGIAFLLAAIMLLAGCSGMSEESYNSVVSENEKLKSRKSSLESEYNSLKSENERLKAENESLQAEIDELNKKLEPQPNEAFKKERFTIGSVQIETSKSNKWYYVEGDTLGITAVTYVDDYNDIDDDIFVQNAFLDIIDIIEKKPHKGAYSFNWAKETGEVVGQAFSMNIMGNTSQSIEWNGDYSHLNDNSTFQTLFKSWINTEN